jgi:large subunit ribosomal protein L10
LIKQTAAYAKFRVPARLNDKYEPREFNPWMFKKRGILQELDERERHLVAQYVRILKGPAVLFFHQNNMTVPDMDKLRRDLRARGVRLQFVNSQLLKGQLLDTRYENIVPLLNGPTVAVWPDAATDGSEATDPIEFTRDVLQMMQRQKKLLLLGGKVESSLLGPQQLEEYGKLPLRSQLYGELVGILQHPGQTLCNLAHAAPATLVRYLDMHASSGDQ